MTSKIRTVTVDAAAPYELASWWAGVTGGSLGEEDVPGDPEVIVHLPQGGTLLFIHVEDERVVKNRIHFDLEPDGPRDEEVDRLLGVGATLVDDRRNPDGTGWAVMADPEGNEFCVLRSAAERKATTPA